ncbi:hypothetical protein OXH62_09670 [Pseudomonas chlororaphis]|uniref:hypothetical protein n=1 Tax=Pseudomonas chlororaphis TaxID=587753 RepID=UPI0035D52B0A
MRLSDLQDVLVSFETEKLEGCRVVYFNETLAEGKSPTDVLEAYSYIVRKDSTLPNARSSIKTFMAERYGGDGILSNGGGGRCGFDGIWQLKGLGANQLVGNNVDTGHSDGNLSLETAVYESIWSEIVNIALPFGAIRTVAILDTGCEYETLGTLTRRGLLVRQPVVRPAHFIRATYFQEKRLNGLSEDAQRVKNAIFKLVDFLPNDRPPEEIRSKVNRLKIGLFELAARFAEQFAAAKAKHIIHYNVSASNLSIDGAWLDLSSTRLFTEKIDIDKVDIDKFNTEHFPAVHCLQDMCYYLRKYSVISTELSTKLIEGATAHFAKVYDKQLRLYQVAQAGFPLWILRIITDSTPYATFSSDLRKLLERNDFAVNPISLESGWKGYERWTARLFSELLSSKIHNENPDLSWLNIDALAITKLVSSYNQLFNLASIVASDYHICLKNFYRSMLINATRLNRSHRVLHDLKEKIEDITTNKKIAYQDLSDEAVSAAKLNLSTEKGRCIPFWMNRMLSIWFNPISGKLTLHQNNNKSLSTAFYIRDHQADINKALIFYGTAWSELNEKAV